MDRVASDVSLSRRELLSAAGVGVGMAISPAALAAAEPATAEPENATIGSGKWRYTLVPGWGAPPEGMKYEWGCAIVVDSRDRVYVHSRAQRSVLVFDRSGALVKDFGAEFARTGHGLYLSREGSDEFLYFTDHPRNLVVKTDLDGKVLMRIGAVSQENPSNIRFPFNQPTDVAVAPNGDVWVCEGYGANLVHTFSAAGKFIRTVGSPGSGPGQFKTCHGIWVDTRKQKDEPEIYVADRNNNRIQVFDPRGSLKRMLYDGIRNPCCFYEHRGKLFVPDLDKVVTILDERDAVVAQLGDGRLGGEHSFKTPHALTLDSHGDLYVVEWVPDARLRKFRHTPA
jgi:hypothetical protein